MSKESVGQLSTQFTHRRTDKLQTSLMYQGVALGGVCHEKDAYADAILSKCINA